MRIRLAHRRQVCKCFTIYRPFPRFLRASLGTHVGHPIASGPPYSRPSLLGSPTTLPETSIFSKLQIQPTRASQKLAGSLRERDIEDKLWLLVIKDYPMYTPYWSPIRRHCLVCKAELRTSERTYQAKVYSDRYGHPNRKSW